MKHSETCRNVPLSEIIEDFRKLGYPVSPAAERAAEDGLAFIVCAEDCEVLDRSRMRYVEIARQLGWCFEEPK